MSHTGAAQQTPRGSSRMAFLPVGRQCTSEESRTVDAGCWLVLTQAMCSHSLQIVLAASCLQCTAAEAVSFQGSWPQTTAMCSCWLSVLWCHMEWGLTGRIVSAINTCTVPFSNSLSVAGWNQHGCSETCGSLWEHLLSAFFCCSKI